ncbi:hypothetical protein NPIL_260971 [Nephila pilipes]|uniref:Uncharacterized protein n=1 Tax=Nephila pilipes TaxID=299642 RepID=A0A8X6Q6A8_NEPPI|nr:hypothetical protein NPIL_260971 [Nephila pilipes]
MEQKQPCFEITWDKANNANTNYNNLKIRFTGDESWVYGCDSETKRQISQGKRPSFQGSKKVSRATELTPLGRCIMITPHKAQPLPNPGSPL